MTTRTQIHARSIRHLAPDHAPAFLAPRGATRPWFDLTTVDPMSLTYDDVLLVPQPHTEIESRRLVDTSVAFGPWRLDTTSDGATLTGALVSSDAYRIEKAPLKAVLLVGRQRLTYPVQSLTVSGPTVTASLGPREVEA